MSNSAASIQQIHDYVRCHERSTVDDAVAALAGTGDTARDVNRAAVAEALLERALDREYALIKTVERIR